MRTAFGRPREVKTICLRPNATSLTTLERSRLTSAILSRSIRASGRQTDDYNALYTARKIAGQLHLRVTIEEWDWSPPQTLDPAVRETSLAAMAARGHGRTVLSSWAGHDAAVLARYVPHRDVVTGNWSRKDRPAIPFTDCPLLAAAH